MILDIGSLMFNMNITGGGGTPSWGTAMGQGEGYKFLESLNTFITSLVYNSVSDEDKENIYCPLGKGGNRQEDYQYVLVSKFNKVYVNEEIIPEAQFLLLVVKQIKNESGFHIGRKTLKYSPAITLNGEEINKNCYEKIKEHFNLNDHSAWFIYQIETRNQDELHFNMYISNATSSENYSDVTARKQRVNELVTQSGICFHDNDKEVLPIRQKNNYNLISFNTILYGAPGTGKTYSMPEYAIAILEKENVDHIKCLYKDKRDELLKKYNNYLDKERVIFTTFHQSYGYEDFIQGLRPDVESNELKFKVTDGVFKIIADKALDDPDNNYVIIIDEINRGNISKIFGELITLIEDDKRWGEAEQTSVKLASGDVFTVPNNLYILGTMNSADKSISLVDAALRRRFNFIEIEPNSKLLNDEFSKFLDQINTHLKRELQSKDLLIGHSYFINKSVKDFDNIINKNIIPLLYEYFFDDETKVKKALDGINVVSYKDDEDGKTYVFELKDSNVGRVKCIKKEAADNN